MQYCYESLACIQQKKVVTFTMQLSSYFPIIIGISKSRKFLQYPEYSNFQFLGVIFFVLLLNFSSSLSAQKLSSCQIGKLHENFGSSFQLFKRFTTCFMVIFLSFDLTSHHWGSIFSFL